jgi:hypothetical protein
MTTRSRSRSYTDRLHQRMAAPRKRRSRTPSWLARFTPPWLTLRVLSAAVLGVAELGSLAAAEVEWPDSLPRGLFHVLAAAVLGLLAATVYFGRSRVELSAGAVLAALLAVAWPAGAIAGLSPFRQLPGLAAAALTLLEAAAAALLAVAWSRDR